jgi:hypothetical protein
MERSWRVEQRVRSRRNAAPRARVVLDGAFAIRRLAVGAESEAPRTPAPRRERARVGP